jgi:hypothetical protein
VAYRDVIAEFLGHLKNVAESHASCPAAELLSKAARAFLDATRSGMAWPRRPWRRSPSTRVFPRKFASSTSR